MDKSVFERSNLQQICSFILFREETTPQSSSCEERLEEARKIAYDELENLSNEKVDKGALQDALCEAFAEHEAVCTEIGMRLGAKLALQLLGKEGV